MSTMGERIKAAREAALMSQHDLARAINVKTSAVISNWERDLNKPDADKIIKLCEVLKIAPSYLLDYFGKSDFECTLSEQEHIKKYRSLDGYGKKAVDGLLNAEYTRVQEQSMQIEEESAPYTYAKTEYLTGLSAGTGLFVFDDIPTQIVDVPEEFKSADFVIGVSGDSMEPTFRDGDRVAVIKQKVLHPGDIGVFMIDGNGYIKELGNNVLISHNSKYDPIPFAESICCIGRVLGKI